MNVRNKRTMIMVENIQDLTFYILLINGWWVPRLYQHSTIWVLLIGWSVSQGLNRSKRCTFYILLYWQIRADLPTSFILTLTMTLLTFYNVDIWHCWHCWHLTLLTFDILDIWHSCHLTFLTFDIVDTWHLTLSSINDLKYTHLKKICKRFETHL